jgi:hypothetical protein
MTGLILLQRKFAGSKYCAEIPHVDREEWSLPQLLSGILHFTSRLYKRIASLPLSMISPSFPPELGVL